MRSWLLYIPAGLIEIHPHMKYQLAITNRSWFLPWTKILTWSTDIRTHGKPEGSVPPADRGRRDIKTVEVAIAYAAWVRFSMSCMRVNDTGQNTITWLNGSLSPSLPPSLSPSLWHYERNFVWPREVCMKHSFWPKTCRAQRDSIWMPTSGNNFTSLV